MSDDAIHDIPRDDRTKAREYVGKIWTPIEIEEELDRLRDVVADIITHLVIVDRDAVAAKRTFDVVHAKALINAEGKSEKIKQAIALADDDVIAARERHETLDHVVRMTRERLREAYQAIDIVRSISASIGRSIPAGGQR